MAAGLTFAVHCCRNAQGRGWHGARASTSSSSAAWLPVFFVAGWMATPTEHSGLGGIGLWQAVVAVAALIVAWLSVRWGDRQKGRGGAAGPRFRQPGMRRLISGRRS